jgi:hypothetical protein
MSNSHHMTSDENHIPTYFHISQVGQKHIFQGLFMLHFFGGQTEYLDHESSTVKVIFLASQHSYERPWRQPGSKTCTDEMVQDPVERAGRRP